MTDETISRSFPENKYQGLDREVLKDRLSACMNDYLAWLSSCKIETKSKTICKIVDKGIGWIETSFPSYPRFIPEGVSEALSKKGVHDFFQYLWEQDAQPRSYTGPSPKRGTWEINLLNEFIHDPLIRVLNEHAIENAIDEVDKPTWEITSQLLENIFEEVCSRIIDDKYTYIAKCPLAWVEGEVGAEFTLGEGVILKLYSERDRASYLTRHDYKLSSTNFHSIMLSSKAVLEITGSVNGSDIGSPPQKKGTKGDVAEEQISNIIDCVKWALFLNLNKNIPLREGDVIYEDILGGSFGNQGILRREERSSGTTYELDDSSLDLTKQFISRIIKYLPLSEDIRQAMWHWGRSCHYNLPRDVLLESIIGLEALLVANAGETRFKFGLYGAALLSPKFGDKEAIAKKLRTAYDGRSSIAHGSKKHKSVSHDDARVYLADAIARILDLYEAGILDPSSNTSEQIAIIILKNASLNV